MKLQVTIPQMLVTLETTDGTLPEGTLIQLSVPVKGLATQPVPAPAPTPDPVPAPAPVEPTPEPIPSPSPNPVKHMPTLDRIYNPVEFRAKRFDILGKAPALGLSNANWTIVLNVRFIRFGTNIRVIGSATHSDAGSSLQIGALNDGTLWVDTFQGGLTAGKLELNRWYEVAVSLNREKEEKIYLDKKLISAVGNIPVFHSEDDVYVGRWLNDYSDFDLKRVRIYPLLSDEEIKEI